MEERKEEKVYVEGSMVDAVRAVTIHSVGGGGSMVDAVGGGHRRCSGWMVNCRRCLHTVYIPVYVNVVYR